MTRPPAALCVLIAATLSVVAQEQAVQTARSDTPTFDWVLFRPHADDEWTPFTGLSADEVRKLRAAAGITDEKANPIALIDTRTLGHAHILFVTAAGEQHCLDISVLVRKGKGFRKLWSAKTAPDGTNFCRPAFCAVPRAQTAKRGRIQVSVPIRLPGAPPGLCDQTSLLTYRRKGKSYELSDQQTVTAGCGLEAYRHALNAAL